jgi:hypothetical protein
MLANRERDENSHIEIRNPKQTSAFKLGEPNYPIPKPGPFLFWIFLFGDWNWFRISIFGFPNCFSSGRSSFRFAKESGAFKNQYPAP